MYTPPFPIQCSEPKSETTASLTPLAGSNPRLSVPKLSMLDACVCVCAFRCVRRCAVRCPPVAVSGHVFRCVLKAVSKGPRKVQLGNQQCRFPFIYKTQIFRNLAYPQTCLYYQLAISPRCFYPHAHSFVTLHYSVVTQTPAGTIRRYVVQKLFRESTALHYRPSVI